ncbi:PCI domain-containing protein [Phakopsora pachyrhizi]|nr:PCI domain-containing protein [Phakopsora pachyrhizi]
MTLEYDFDYEDDDQDDVDADVENKYYQAKNNRVEQPDKSLADWRSIVDTEDPKGEWGFKALKQSTKLNFRRAKYHEALQTYTELLSYCKSAVTRNAAEKSINGILDYVSAAQDLETSLMEKWFETTQSALADAHNEKLSVKTDLKLAKIWLDRKEYSRLEQITAKLRKKITGSQATTKSGTTQQIENFEGDNSIGTLLLEVLAIEIQMYTDRKESKKLRSIYDQTLTVKSTIPHPRIMGIIRECGGKMHMSEKNWASAQYDFFEAFKNYDEAGSPQRISSLKYLSLAHMLMDSGIDPFNSQETKPYKQDPEIVAMTNLVDAYQRRDIHEAEKIIRTNKKTIMEDQFIAQYIKDLLNSLRTQWILGILQSYTRIKLSHIAKQLKISVDEVEEILSLLILDEKLKGGKIDQINGIFQIDSRPDLSERYYKELKRWNDSLSSVNSQVLTKVNNLNNQSLMGNSYGPINNHLVHQFDGNSIGNGSGSSTRL